MRRAGSGGFFKGDAVELHTLGSPFRKVRSVNQTGAFPAIPGISLSATEPGGTAEDANTATGISIINLTQPDGGMTENTAIIMPYGLHATPDAKTSGMRVYGYRRLGNDATSLWIGALLIDVDYIMSSDLIGAAGKILIATEALANSITLVDGNDDVDFSITAPTASTSAGHIKLAVGGWAKLRFVFGAATSAVGTAATSRNALVSFQ